MESQQQQHQQQLKMQSRGTQTPVSVARERRKLMWKARISFASDPPARIVRASAPPPKNWYASLLFPLDSISFFDSIQEPLDWNRYLVTMILFADVCISNLTILISRKSKLTDSIKSSYTDTIRLIRIKT